MASGFELNGRESKGKRRARLQKAYDAAAYSVFARRPNQLRRIRRRIRAEMAHPTGAPTPPVGPLHSGIKMPGDLWDDMIAGQDSVLGACRNDLNQWRAIIEKCHLAERELECHGTLRKSRTETETIVSVDLVVEWLYETSQRVFVNTGTPRYKIGRKISRNGGRKFWYKPIRKPIWMQTHLPQVKAALRNEELGDLIRKSLTVNLWGNGSGSGDDGSGSGDSLAWYVPFHNNRENWGVYIPVTGLLQCANGIAPSGFKGLWLDLVELALRGLLAHELIHYVIEYRSAQLERLMEAPCYLAGQKALLQGGHVPLEEKLANGALLRSIQYEAGVRKIAGAYESAETFTKKQSRGYRDGQKSVRTRNFLANANDLMRRIANSLPKVSALSDKHPMDFGARPATRIDRSTVLDLNGSQCPIYLIRDEVELGVPLGGAIEVT